MFLAYLVTMLYAHKSFRWDVRTFLLAADATIPPCATLVFEILADRRGLLDAAETVSDEARSTDEAVSAKG